MEHLTTGLIAAAISAAVSIVTAAGTIVVATYTLRRQYRLEFMAESAVEELLKQPPYRMRTFEVIKYHLAGFEENELRRILVRAGAVRWQSKSDKEMWGLLERNHSWLSETRLPLDPDTSVKLGEGPRP